MGLKYVGHVNPHDSADREAVHPYPARDLTEEEVGKNRKELLASKLYVEDDPPPARAAAKETPKAAPDDK